MLTPISSIFSDGYARAPLPTYGLGRVEERERSLQSLARQRRWPYACWVTVDEALKRASAEIGLQSYYQSLVRPLLKQPEEPWPSCCGGGCEPCAVTLVAVARRAQQLLATSSAVTASETI